MSTDELLDLVRRYAAERYPRTPAVRLRIDLAGGEAIRLPIADGPAAAVAAGVKLTEADRTVLEAVAGLGEAPTGQEIARAAGYPYDSHVKMRLSLLRRRGLLGGAKGEAGYPLTDLAAELLAAQS